MLQKLPNLKTPETSRRVRRLTIIAAAIGGAVIALFALYKFVGEPLMIKFFIGSAPAPVSTVSATPAQTRAYQPKLNAVGTLVAVQGADLTAQFDGVVREVFFNSGDDVAAGARLVRLDDETATALLKQRQADAENAQREFERNSDLAKRGNVSRSALDAARSRRDQAVAAVAQAQAAADQKVITAPFAGRTGVRRANVGEFVRAGTSIVTLQTLQPIYVNFDLPEQALAQVAVGQTVALTTDIFPGKTFSGTLTSFDPKVDPNTRNFLAQATLANEERKLAPGMFARLDVHVGAPVAQVSVPETAVTYSLAGDTVFVVVPNADKKTEDKKEKPAPPVVEQRRVKLGDSENGWIAILDGLKAGEQVVTAGQIKLRPGTPVAIDNSVALTASETPSKY